MDRVFSARIDDAVYRKINDLADKMHSSKKAVLEKAVTLLGKQVQRKTGSDVFDETCGAWKRRESVAETVAGIRGAFKRSFRRHHE